MAKRRIILAWLTIAVVAMCGVDAHGLRSPIPGVVVAAAIPNPAYPKSFYTLHDDDATTIAQLLAQVFTDGKFTFLSDPRTNSIVFLAKNGASMAELHEIVTFVTRLDTKPSRDLSTKLFPLVDAPAVIPSDDVLQSADIILQAVSQFVGASAATQSASAGKTQSATPTAAASSSASSGGISVSATSSSSSPGKITTNGAPAATATAIPPGSFSVSGQLTLTSGQQQPAQATSPSGGSNTGSPAGQSPTTAPPSSSTAVAFLTPDYHYVVVRASVQTIAALQIAWPQIRSLAYKSQDYEVYDVRFPVPLPVPSGDPTTAVSSVQDLATTVQNTINQQGILDVRVSADASYPRIILAGTRPNVAQAMKLLRALDSEPAVIELNAYVYEIDENIARNIGLNFPTNSLQATISEYYPPATGATLATPPPILDLGKIVKTPLSLSAQLNLLMQNGYADLISNPHVATLNGRGAVLQITNNIPFVSYTLGQNGFAAASVTNYATGTRLEVVPMINTDGSISAYVHPLYSTLTGYTTQGAPQISTREISTTLRLQPNQSVVISGIQSEEYSQTEGSIPGLSRLPGIGGLFRNPVRTRTRSNLLVVLEPSVVTYGALQLEKNPVPTNPLQTRPSTAATIEPLTAIPCHSDLVRPLGPRPGRVPTPAVPPSPTPPPAC